MASTFDNNLRLREMGTGDESGTWGTRTNENLELIGEALGFGTEAITTNADNHSTTINDGATDPGRAMYLKYTGALDSACTVTLGPDTISKLWFIENATSGSQNLIIKQGSGSTVTIPASATKLVYSDGLGSSAAVVDALDKIDLGANAKINGGQCGITATETATSTNKTINGPDNTITNLSNSNIASDAAIAGSKLASAIDSAKIADGSVSNTEFQYLNGVTSAIQTQLDAAVNFAINTWITSSENDERFYFANSGESYYKADGSHIFQNGSGTNRFSVDTSGNGVFAGDITAYGSPSDMSLKENVNVIDNALAKVNQLNGITYDLKSDGNRLTGLVAQDLQEVLPEAVYTHKDIETKEEHLAIRYGNTVGLLVEAIKELSEEVKRLKEDK